MTMSASTLADAFLAMPAVETEAEAIAEFVDAWETYFSEATVNGIAINSGSLSGALSSMSGAMTGLSTTGALSMAAGIVAFWGTVSTSVASIWTLAPVLVSATPPPGVATIATLISVTGIASTVGALSAVDATTAMASTIHTPNLGGIAIDTTVPTPIGWPIL